MTTEQLAELIGQGDNNELLPLLWEKMRKLYRMWSDGYYTAHKERCDLCGVTPDDLRQEGYLSMLEAVKAYNSRSEEHKDTSFTSFCKFPFKSHAAELTGTRTHKRHNEPLNRCRSDIDSPLPGVDGDSSETIGTTTPDPEAEQPFRDIEHSDYCRSIRAAVANTLKEDSREHQVIKCRYYEDLTLKETGKAFGLSIERIRQLEKAAMRQLRNSRGLRSLQR